MSGLFGLELPATATFDHPTIDALAQYIASRAAPADVGPQPASQLVPSTTAIAHRLMVRSSLAGHPTMLLSCSRAESTGFMRNAADNRAFAMARPCGKSRAEV